MILCVFAVDAGLVLGHPGPCDFGTGAGLQAADHRCGVRVHPAALNARALRLDQEEEAHRRCVFAQSCALLFVQRRSVAVLVV